jgi:hypothetical protein
VFSASQKRIDDALAKAIGTGGAEEGEGAEDDEEDEKVEETEMADTLVVGTQDTIGTVGYDDEDFPTPKAPIARLPSKSKSKSKSKTRRSKPKSKSRINAGMFHFDLVSNLLCHPNYVLLNIYVLQGEAHTNVHAAPATTRKALYTDGITGVINPSQDSIKFWSKYIHGLVPTGGWMMDCYAGSGSIGFAGLLCGVNVLSIEKDEFTNQVQVYVFRWYHML